MCFRFFSVFFPAQKSHYDGPRCGFLLFVLLGICRASWGCCLMTFISLGKFLANILQLLLLPFPVFSLLSCWVSNLMYMRPFHWVLYMPLRSLSIFSKLLSLFELEYFLLIFQFTNVFLVIPNLLLNQSIEFLISVIIFQLYYFHLGLLQTPVPWWNSPSFHLILLNT